MKLKGGKQQQQIAQNKEPTEPFEYWYMQKESESTFVGGQRARGEGNNGGVCVRKQVEVCCLSTPVPVANSWRSIYSTNLALDTQ